MQANEVEAMFMEHDKAWEDRKCFVHNFGELLKQTRAQVQAFELLDTDEILVTYRGGCTKTINVHMDSYMAIIKDVAKNI